MANHKSKTKKTDRDLWRTPTRIYSYARATFGDFDFDAACTYGNALAPPLWTHGSEFTEGDSLSAPWPDGKLIWCNPPYSRIKPWVKAAIACRSRVVMFFPSPNGESVYSEVLDHAYERHLIGRVAFIDTNGKPRSGNERGSSFHLFNFDLPPGGRDHIHRDRVFSIGGAPENLRAALLHQWSHFDRLLEEASAL